MVVWSSWWWGVRQVGVAAVGVVSPDTAAGALRANGNQAATGDNPFLEYFGPASGPIATQAYDKYAEENYDLPEAYKGATHTRYTTQTSKGDPETARRKGTNTHSYRI